MANQISDRFKCIFIHIPRAAGSSIEDTSIFKDQRDKTGEEVGGHASAKEYRERWPDKFNSYFKFTFVRNPYSRAVSAFFYLSHGGSRNAYDNKIFEKYFKNQKKDFNSFCINQLSKDVINDAVHFSPQHTFLCDDNMNILVDFIGRQENFENDAKKLFKTIGIPFEYMHINKSDHKHYSEYYTKESQEKVFNLYKPDFDILKYSPEIDRRK